MPRAKLEPFADLDSLMIAMGESVKAGAMLQFARPGTNKRGAVDLFSCGGITSLWNGLAEDKRAILRNVFAKLQNDPGRFALYYWQLVKRAKS